MTIAAENQYQKSFHDFAYHMNQIHDQLGKVMLLNDSSAPYQRELLLKLTHLSSDAQNDVNDLPLNLISFDQTNLFLSHFNQFTTQLALRDFKQNPLQANEKQTIKTLYSDSNQIKNVLQHIQNTVIQNHLKWTDTQFALASDTNHNLILDGFNHLDQRVHRFKQLNWGASMTGIQVKSNVQQKQLLSKKQLIEHATALLDLNPTKKMSVKRNGNETFSLKAISNSGEPVLADFKVDRGEILWFMKNRPITQVNLSMDQAESESSQTLMDFGYKNMVPIAHDQYDGVAVITYAQRINGVIHYPHQVTVKIAKDNGETIGLQASNYVMTEHQGISNQLHLTESEAITRYTLNRYNL
jgi:spore germination protein